MNTKYKFILAALISIGATSSISAAVKLGYVFFTSQPLQQSAEWGDYKLNSKGDALFPNILIGYETQDQKSRIRWQYNAAYSKDVLNEDCFSISMGPIFQVPFSDQFYWTFSPAISLTKASFFEYEAAGSTYPSIVNKNVIDFGVNLSTGISFIVNDSISVRAQYDWIGIRPHRILSDFADVLNSINGNNRVWTGAWQGYSTAITLEI